MKYLVWLSFVLILSSCALPQGLQTTPQPELNKQLSNQKMDHKNSFFVARKGVKDGYVFIFHVMPAPEGEAYSRSNYHLMVSVEKDGQPIHGLALSSRVKHPDGTVQEDASMMSMGEWYMSLYNLDHEQGRHWITVSFDQGGHRYSTGIYYPERAYRQ